MYEKILKPIFFRFDPEAIHDFFVGFGAVLGACPLGRWIVGKFCDYEHPALHMKVSGMEFRNPVGLAAGFDKDIRLTKIMPSVGFGFMEVGAVTRYPYLGNDGLRLARLPKDESLIVYYGLKNIGAEAVERKVRRLKFRIPVGLNIAKTNRADIKGEKSIEDYAATYRMLAQHFAYVTLNVSCPNAQDGCLFQEPHLLDSLLGAMAKEEKRGPIFLKVSVHLSTQEMDAILAVVERYPFVDGFVIGNLAKRRDLLHLASPPAELGAIPEGGISGRPIRAMSTDLIRYLYRKTKGKYVIIGLGGIFTAEDAYEKIKAGASLIQIVTGLIYGGPETVKKINRGLVELLTRDGYSSIREAVGTSAQ